MGCLSMTAGTLVLVALAAGMQPAAAQTPARDPSARLQAVLPADVASRVLARIADARAHDLPAAALEHRAEELAAKRATPDQVESGVNTFADQLAQGRGALVNGGRVHPADQETEAAAEAMGKGVDGAAVSALAKSAPSGRSLAVPLLVMSGLVDRGLPSDQALAKVQAKLAARASDQALLNDAGQSGESHGQADAEHGRPAVTGQAIGQSHRPADVGRPASVPANPGQGYRPSSTPVTPPSHPTDRP